jgi:hypothetical protein
MFGILCNSLLAEANRGKKKKYIPAYKAPFTLNPIASKVMTASPKMTEDPVGMVMTPNT